jgi:hypothetical protein
LLVMALADIGFLKMFSDRLSRTLPFKGRKWLRWLDCFIEA